MMHLTYVLPLVCVAVLAWIGIRYKPVISSAAFLIICISFWYAWSSLMGYPKVSSFTKEIDVFAYLFDEPDHIYIWSLTNPPISYRLPWDMEQAKQLQKGYPARYEWKEGEWNLHKKPQEDLPPKE